MLDYPCPDTLVQRISGRTIVYSIYAPWVFILEIKPQRGERDLALTDYTQ